MDIEGFEKFENNMVIMSVSDMTKALQEAYAKPNIPFEIVPFPDWFMNYEIITNEESISNNSR